MKMPNQLICLLIFCQLLFSCKGKEEDCSISEDITEIPINLEIHRMEQNFFENVTADKIKYELAANPKFSEALFGNMPYDNWDQLAEELRDVHLDPDMQDLYGEVSTYFSDLNALEDQLTMAFKAIKYYYPSYEVPEIYTFVTGFGTDLIVTDQLIIIGLDYFLPEDHRFQPVDLPHYISKRYNQDHLVPTLVTAISSQFNQTDLKDNTLLAEMIYYGKAYHFTKTILPCTPDEYIIGYESDEVIGSYANEVLIWGHFIENELLYETNPFEKRKYTGEAPFTDEISPDAPGRIGRWLGWNIVDDYRANNDLSIQEVMDQDDAREIFRQSGYKPR
jgi:gliding motility-associated lipoprotein GldB